MTWTKLSDDFGDDCWSLSDAAFRLHVEAHCWSNRKLLDCRISEGDLRRFAKRPEAALELLERGWWKRDGDCYVLLHHAGYQPTAEQVAHIQATNRENGRKGGRPKKGSARAGSSPSKNRVANRVANPFENPQGRDGTGALTGERVERTSVTSLQRALDDDGVAEVMGSVTLLPDDDRDQIERRVRNLLEHQSVTAVTRELPGWIENKRRARRAAS